MKQTEEEPRGRSIFDILKSIYSYIIASSYIKEKENYTAIHKFGVLLRRLLNTRTRNGSIFSVNEMERLVSYHGLMVASLVSLFMNPPLVGSFLLLCLNHAIEFFVLLVISFIVRTLSRRLPHLDSI